MRHLSDAATAWELEAERRREVLEADAARAQARQQAHVVVGPGLIDRLAERFAPVKQDTHESMPVCGTAASVKPGG